MRRSFLTPFMFTILPSNLIQLLKNEIFEESAAKEKTIWKDLKLIRQPTQHKSHFRTLKAILYCGMWKWSSLEILNSRRKQFSGRKMTTVIWRSKWNQALLSRSNRQIKKVFDESLNLIINRFYGFLTNHLFVFKLDFSGCKSKQSPLRL